MMRQVVLMVFIAAVVGACAQNKPRVVSSPYSDGVSHAEPVFYNGKHYKMRFKYQAARNLYDVNVIGKGGRKLGSQSGDQKIVGDMASSAIRHFACARSQKAYILPGSPRHAGGAWNMQAQCR